VGGAGGLASGHRGIMVELEDGATAPDEDPRQPATRSAPAEAKPDGARRWIVAMTCGGKREVSGGDRSTRQRGGVSSAWMRQARSGSVASPDRFNTCAKNAVVTSGGQVGLRHQRAGPAEGIVTDKWAVGLYFST
jgi:hypothetical protein